MAGRAVPVGGGGGRPAILRRLWPLVAPRSIAIVGASEAAGSWAPEFFDNLRHAGFDGLILPVNPKYREVWGLRCVPSPADLPPKVDVALLLVPARLAARALEDAADAGVRSAIVVASGFAEAGETGATLQADLAAVAERRRIPMLGPNVEGYINATDGVACYGAGPPPSLSPGGLTVVSQSGTVAWGVAQMAADRGLGIRLVLGVGNEAGLSLGELLEWAAADPETTVVAAYLETVRAPRSIARGAEALRRAGKPLLVCAAGHGEAAARAVVAHTGALAGRTGVRDAWLRRLGAALVPGPIALFEAAALACRAPRMPVPGVAAALQSGGSCTLFAEHAEAAGLSMPSPAAITTRRLRRALPSFASVGNPLDVTGQAAVETRMFEAALAALARDPRIGLVVFDAFPSREPTQGIWEKGMLAAAERLAAETGTAMVSLTPVPLALDEDGRKLAAETTLPVLQGIAPAALAIRALVDLSVRHRRSSLPAHPARRKLAPLLRGARGPLDEPRARRILRLYGVEGPAEDVAGTPEGAAGVAARLGFPVAVKAVAESLPHKADAGAVRLGIRSGEEAERAARAVLRAASRRGVVTRGVLVQRMERGAEILVGGIHDERLGPAVTLRPGGPLAEAGAAEFLAAPLLRGEATEFVRARAADLGLAPRRHDLAALASALEAVSRVLVDAGGRLLEVEANPLIVRRRGAVAVDALAVVA